jgi:hypothetical protein
VMVSNRPDGVARMAGQRVFMGDPKSTGYRRFRAGIAEFVASMPPNSHGEANPADKDPVPAPFDNTYNSPEHDAFVIKVKYQRTDEFFTRNLVDGEERAALDQAWNLFGSWPHTLPGHAPHPRVTTGGRRMGHDPGGWRSCRRRTMRAPPEGASRRGHPGVPAWEAGTGRHPAAEPRRRRPRAGGAGGPARVLSRAPPAAATPARRWPAS